LHCLRAIQAAPDAETKIAICASAMRKIAGRPELPATAAKPGLPPWTRAHRAVWLEVSHWPGELPKLEIWPDWVYGNRYNDLFGRFTYKGQPIYGSGTTNYGAPTDGYGRLVYLDTLGAPLAPLELPPSRVGS
jgi:hypothetical protein